MRRDVLAAAARVLKRAWRQRVSADHRAERAGPSVGASPAALRPYDEVLARAAVDGRVLHREHIYGSGPPNEVPNQGVLDILVKWAGASVLDVGCGIGTYTASLHERGIRATGIEIDPAHVDRARALGRSVQRFDGAVIPFADASFDCVAAVEVLEHVPEWEALLREMVRVAARTVVISVPNIGVLPAMSRYLVGPWHLLEATHVNFFTADILRTVLRRTYPELRCDTSEYGLFEINGEIFANHVLAVLQK